MNTKWILSYLSPFKHIIPTLYVGKIAIGTPIFFPRKWVKCVDKPGYLCPIPRVFGFDFIGLGYKTKWSDLDIREEWNPVWSFVFFKWQVAIIFSPSVNHYWECWLIYHKHTDKTKSSVERISEAREKFPCIWTKYEKDTQIKVDYWELCLKSKYL